MSVHYISTRLLLIVMGSFIVSGCATDRSTPSTPQVASVTNYDALGIDPVSAAALFDGPPATAAQVGDAYAAACIPVVGMRIEESSAHARSLGYGGGTDLDTRELRTKNVFYKVNEGAPGSIVNMFQTDRDDNTSKGGCSIMMSVADPDTAELQTRQYLTANTAMTEDGPNFIKLENGMMAMSDGTMISNSYTTGFSSKRIPTGDGRIADILIITSVTELARQ